jgi:HEAT repeat protein
MKRLAVILALVACGSEPREVPPQPRTAEIPQPRVAPALPAKQVPGLAEDLKDPDPKVRRAAVREADDAKTLLAASRDPDLEVAATATEALGKLHARSEVSVDEMIARATDRSLNERVRVSALNGLGLVASPDAAKTLVELVHRGDTIEKRSAAILLVHQDPEVAMPALIDALGDADEVVRANALEALKSRARGRDFGSDSNAWRSWWQSRSR